MYVVVAGRIFNLKSEEDFKTIQAVSWQRKSLAALIVILVNCAFAYYAILRGNQKGERTSTDYPEYPPHPIIC